MRKTILVAFALFQVCADQVAAEPEKELFEWGEWSTKVVDEALADDKPVFVEFFADWCATCMVNRKRCFQNEKVTSFLKARKIVALRADVTTRNEKTKKALKDLNRMSVPTYVLYIPGKKEAIILPEILGPKDFLKLTNQALRENSQQDSDDQPATVSESKPEGKQKAQPKSEVRRK